MSSRQFKKIAKRAIYLAGCICLIYYNTEIVNYIVYKKNLFKEVFEASDRQIPKNLVIESYFWDYILGVIMVIAWNVVYFSRAIIYHIGRSLGSETIRY